MADRATMTRAGKCLVCGRVTRLNYCSDACLREALDKSAQATDARAAKPNVYGWMLARHATRTILKVPRLRVRVTIQLWRPWRDDA